ncbi:MAG: TonB-dependent receptor [Gammaproteobacteria bacterium]|nr:TonB-dependent receptor [Gammaproteobacteria bacterium]MBT5724296.1 TonB-dependent receptor [Gammaproteobacteria bacterium]MBT6890340.1 TonB-dependent receptor [Gammaproteobacteria bacterium]
MTKLRIMGRHALLTTVTVMGALSVTSTSVYAEADEAGRQIEEVIVTAERREASIQDTSISITAFTGEMLDDFGIRNQEDLQNFVPATTIQPYDATIRGVGRNFRALGGDPGVATYMNGVYSEDLLTATAATFWDVERVEVLRGPQGTLYGRNAVGGAINILYKQPSHEFDYSVKGIVGNFGTAEYYGMMNGSIIEDKLSARINFSVRDRDGVIEEIGDGSDLDGLGTVNVAAQFRFTPSDTLAFDVRFNKMEIDRDFGGANGGGLVVLDEEGQPFRNTTNIVPGYRAIDTANTDPANYAQNSWYDASQPILSFVDPTSGANVQAQHNRLGVDLAEFSGFRNSAASLDGFGVTSAESAARYNDCVFSGSISGDDVCAATNGLNREEFNQQGVQFSTTWTATENLEIKYIYGYNKLSYERTTDDDNTASQFSDRQFYVNHEAVYDSHELQAFWDISENLSVTSGIFFYDALIDQRGDFYSSVGEDRFINPYVDNTGLDAAIVGYLPIYIGAVNPAGVPASTSNGVMPTLHSARTLCEDPATRKAQCEVNYASKNPSPSENNNLHVGVWGGDDGTNPDLDVKHGINSVGSDLLYHTRTEREAFAAYTQAVWDINETFTLTLGIRYAEDEVDAQENLWRYSEIAYGFIPAFTGGAVDLFTYNVINGGIDLSTGVPVGTEKAVNGGVPVALSVYRGFNRKDTETTGRINLDWNVTDNTLLYLSATSGYRSGGNNLVFFSATPDYDPEELLAYEFGYKLQLLDNSLQVNGSFYYYDYEQIHTVATEVTPPLVVGGAPGTTTSVLPAPGAEIWGIEAEALWLATDRWTLGGNFSYTPSEYTEDLFIQDPAEVNTPESLFPDAAKLTQNINGNQILQVPELKYTAFASYLLPLAGGSNLELFGVYSWIDDVYYSPFEAKAEMAESYDRTDVRATWTSADKNWVVSGFVNNIFDDIGVLQVVREGEGEFFRHSAGTTAPRMYGLEVTYSLGQ